MKHFPQTVYEENILLIHLLYHAHKKVTAIQP